MIVGLNDLIIVVVEGGQHGRPAGDPRDTSLDGGHVLRSIVRMLPVVSLVGDEFLLGLRRQRRYSPVLGVGDDGSTLVRQGPPGILLKRRIVIPDFPRPLRGLEIRGLRSLSRILFKGPGFVIR